MVTRTKKIFVGGLSTTTTLDEVKEYFAKFGEVRVVTNYEIMIYPDNDFRSRMPCSCTTNKPTDIGDLAL